MHHSSEIIEAPITQAARMIKDNILAEPIWMARGILAIYDRQTADEQSNETTRYHNGVGFGAMDANILSSLAKQLKRGRALSPKQTQIANKNMPKYCKQLARIAQSN
tara:strand:- start:1232 stop:1552 length:321 start_codon:yes stop_codon:yes gene_type:complete